MGTSAWFDYNVYMTNKLVQVQKAEPAAGWDMAKLVKAFSDADFGGAVGAEKHFEEYGQYEDVAPNAFFNATEYFRAKAAQFYEKAPKAVTDLEVTSMQLAIKDAGMSAWSHYEMFGNTEKVNPSNNFDTEAYMNAKLTALNSVKDGKQWTLAELNEAFKNAGLSALEHFMTYGGAGDGEVTQKYDGKIPTAFAVPEDKKVNADASVGKTYPLTTGFDDLTGTVGDDTFLGNTVGSDATLNGGDKIDGGAGNDTLRLYGVGAGSVNFANADVKGVENVELLGGGSGSTTANILDTSKNADVKNVIVGTGEFSTANAGIKMGLSQNLVLKGDVTTANSNGMNITYDGADKGITDSVSLTLDNLTMMESGGSNDNATLTINGVENITMNLTGDNAFGGASGAENLVADKLEVLTLKGTGTLSMGIASSNTALKTIDASEAGGVDFVFANFSGNTAFTTFTGSANDDKITIASGAISGGMTFTGGSGDDTLKLKSAVADAAAVEGVTGFEIYEHYATTSQDLSFFKAGNAFESILISSGLASGSGLSGISGEAQRDIRFMADQSGGFLTTAVTHSSLKPQDAKIVLDNVSANEVSGIDLASFTFDAVGTLTIESLSNTVNAVGATTSGASGFNSIGADSSGGLTAAAAEKIYITGNDSLLLSLSAATKAVNLIDASELGKDITTGTKPGLHLTVADDAVDNTNLSIIGTGGNDFITLTEGTGSGDNFTYKYIGNDDIINLTALSTKGTLSLDLQDATLGAGSVLDGGSLIVASGLAGTGNFTKASGNKMVVDFSSDAAGAFIRNGVALDDFTVSSGGNGSWDTAVGENKGFKLVNGVRDNIAICTGASGGLLIQIDVNGDGKFTASDDFKVEIVGTNTANDLNIAYVAAGGDFTLTHN